MLQIVKAPNEILRQKLKPVTRIDRGIINIIREMEETLKAQKDPVGVGLAANQVGLDLQIFLAVINDIITPFINPEILESGKELYPSKDSKNPLLEGCLSLHGFYGPVKRPKSITVRAITITPNIPKSPQLPTDPKYYTVQTKKYTNFPAEIIQHEVDHLNGILFVQRILEQNEKLYEITGTDKDGNTVFEEVKLT
jgi:peptide deformylase